MARILIVDDDRELVDSLTDLMTGAGWTVRQALDGMEAVRVAEEWSPQVILLDLEMPVKGGQEALEELQFLAPDAPVVILTGHGNIGRAVAAMKAGATDFLTKPPDPDHLLVVLERALERSELEQEVTRCRQRGEDRFQMIGGAAPAMKELRDLLERVSSTSSTVLLTGETGTGKELAARHIWKNGPRASAPFVVINCAALSETLLESDLFGHQKGAFTGAVSAKRGRLEEADGGTVFFDEIGELPLSMQSKLLRVLEYGTFERIGDTVEREIDVRLIAATNRDLATEVAEERFREDLFHRISVVSIRIPPLRERMDDLPDLVTHYLHLLGGELGRQIPELDDAVLKRLADYDWPGNIRELRNTLERALVLSPDENVRPEDIPVAGAAGTSADDPLRPEISGDSTLTEGIEAFKRWMVIRTLENCGGNQTRAAERLGMHRSSLNRLMKELNLR
jgi:DNA-binding NtrC family response regulator